MIGINYLFAKHQKSLVKFANHWAGRKFLGIDKECQERIVGLTDNAYIVRLGRHTFKTTFRTYPLFAKKLGLLLTAGDIAGDCYKRLLNQCGFNWRLPIVAFTDLPFYSGAGDGAVGSTSAGCSWADLRGGVGLGVAVTGTTDTAIGTIIGKKSDGNYTQLGRAFMPFNTSSGITGEITAAIFSVVPNAVYDYWSTDAKSRTDIVQTSQADPTTLTTADFGAIGSTVSVSIDNTSLSAGVRAEFTLDATGRSWIDDAGWTYLGPREGHDTDNTEPGTAVSEDRYTGCYWRDSEYAGTDSDPRLDVTFTGEGAVVSEPFHGFYYH